MSARLVLSLCSLVTLGACMAQVESHPELAAVAESLTARDAVLKLSLTSAIDESGLLFEGRTSRGLESAMAFVPDDEVGETSLTETGFETRLPLREVNARLKGSPLFFAMTTSTGEKTHARADLAVRLPASCSTNKLEFDANFRSARVDGVDVLRFTGTTTVPSAKLGASLTRDWIQPTFPGKRSRERFSIDVPLDVVSTAALTGTALTFTAAGGGLTVTRTCTPRVVLANLALDAGDPYDVWPAPHCTDAHRACLALKKNRFDTAACGTLAEVQSCGPTPRPEVCGATLARKLEGLTNGSLWMSETDAPFTRVLERDHPALGLAEALTTALGASDALRVETRELADVMSWPTQDQPEEGERARVQAALFRALWQALPAYLNDVQVVRIGEISIDVYFVGRDACGNLVGLKTLAVET